MTKTGLSSLSKTTKGAIAAGAAALLIGGAGTLAYWNDSESADGGQVATGHLNIVPAGTTGTWTDVTDGGNAEITDISTFSMVPGDTLEYSRDFTVEADGDNLTATVTTSPLAPQSADIAQWVHTTVSIKDGTTQITDAQDGTTVTIKVVVTFDPATPGTIPSGTNAADDDSLDLSGLEIRLDQTQGAAGGN